MNGHSFLQSHYLFLLLAGLMLFPSACKKKAELEVTEVTEPMPPPDLVEEPNDKLEYQDSLMIHYQGTSCFGTCPIFVMKVYRSGYATYDGTNFVERMGKFEGWVPPGAIEAVVAKANGIGYFQMKDKYDAMVSDLPSTITEIAAADGTIKRVDNRYDGPRALQDLYPILDQVIESTEWKPIVKQ